jgi:glycosyltransferase involved in cell wall biosynthesis
MKMRVANIITGLGIGGAEIYLRMVHEKFSSDDTEYYVYFFCCDRNHQVDSLRSLGVKVRCLGHPSKYDIRRFIVLHQALKRDKINLVHAHLPITAVYARLVCKVLDIPVVYTEHNEWSVYHPLTRMINYLTYRLNNKVIAVSDGVATSILSKSVPVEVVNNGIDIDSLLCQLKCHSYNEAKSILKLPKGAFVVGNVANYTPKKNHVLLLKAFANFAVESSSKMPYLVLVGQFFGKKEEVYSLARNLNVADRIRIIDGRQDAINFIRFFDVAVITSKQEGLPISMLEAMSLSKPIISTKVGGIPSVIRQNVEGFLVDMKESSIVEALICLSNSKEECDKMGHMAFKRVKESYTLSRASNEIEYVYKKLL